MKVLIDCSNLQVGGGIQVALSFLNDLNEGTLSDSMFLVVMSPQFADNFSQDNFKNNFKFFELSKGFYKNFMRRSRQILFLQFLDHLIIKVKYLK